MCDSLNRWIKARSSSIKINHWPLFWRHIFWLAVWIFPINEFIGDIHKIHLITMYIYCIYIYLYDDTEPTNQPTKNLTANIHLNGIPQIGDAPFRPIFYECNHVCFYSWNMHEVAQSWLELQQIEYQTSDSMYRWMKSHWHQLKTTSQITIIVARNCLNNEFHFSAPIVV